MLNITVLKPFYDLKAHKDRRPGDTFGVTEARAAHLSTVLPGYVSYVTHEEPKADLSKMTMQQLRQLAAERGVEVKGRKTKAQLIELISKE